MMNKINNLFEVNMNDTLGTALVKGVAKGYIQGVVAAGLGLGVLAIGVMIVSNKEESNEEEEEIENDFDRFKKENEDFIEALKNASNENFGFDELNKV